MIYVLLVYLNAINRRMEEYMETQLEINKRIISRLNTHIDLINKVRVELIERIIKLEENKK